MATRRCIECLGEATVEVLSPEGMTLAWCCAEDWEANQRMHDAMMELLKGVGDAI